MADILDSMGVDETQMPRRRQELTFKTRDVRSRRSSRDYTTSTV